MNIYLIYISFIQLISNAENPNLNSTIPILKIANIDTDVNLLLRIFQSELMNKILKLIKEHLDLTSEYREECRKQKLLNENYIVGFEDIFHYVLSMFMSTIRQINEPNYSNLLHYKKNARYAYKMLILEYLILLNLTKDYFYILNPEILQFRYKTFIFYEKLFKGFMDWDSLIKDVK